MDNFSLLDFLFIFLFSNTYLSLSRVRDGLEREIIIDLRRIRSHVSL